MSILFNQCSSTGRFVASSIHDMELTGFGSYREQTSLREEKSKPKGLIRGKTKIGQVLSVKVTNYVERDGFEIKIDSMKKKMDLKFGL